jgi:glutaredoxin-related protein
MKLKQEDIKNAFYSGYFVKKTQEQLVSWVAGEFRKSSDIKSLKKKQLIQSILEHFSKYFDGLETGFHLYNIQFFVDSEEGHFFELEKDQLEIINRYHKRDVALFEEKPKEYWRDFYFNCDWVSIYEVQKDIIQHYRMTNTKLDELSQFKFDNLDNLGEYISRNPVVLFVQGRGLKVPAYLSKNGYEPVEMAGASQSKHDQLKETYDDYLTQNNIRRMMKALSALDVSPDLFIFGNEVIKEIANYGVKELYCFDEFEAKLRMKMDASLFNFAIISFSKEKMKIYKELETLDSYRGIFGIKYY